jgi:K+-sensing histidine kinase KdpD
LELDLSFSETVDRILEAGTAEFDIGHGHLTRIVPELDHWEVVATTDEVGEPAPLGHTIDLQTTFCRLAISRNDTLAVHDASNQTPEFERPYEEHGWCCYLSTPVEIDGELYGTLCFGSRSPRSESFTDDEIAFVDCLAHIIESKLQQTTLESELDTVNSLIAVFSRVFRHNLRTDLGIIHGHIELLAEQFDASQAELETVTSTIEQLLALSEKSRHLKEIVQRDSELREQSISAIARKTITRIRYEYPAATVALRTPNDVELISFSTVETALYELVENAVKHGGTNPTVTVVVKPSVSDVSITITDEGGGLPRQEQQILMGSRETPLSHGSGLGLWLSRWVVDRHDGTVDVSTSPDGTEITLSFPRPTGNPDLIEIDDTSRRKQ